ncbi:L,D-transpeptidase [Methylocella sp. CPCC 101449]|uniref:L,D-transpeptidase n=1 Tax=Methylocella sp. CPCC 101449 TaxID=2987531 RepID=UPI0028903BAD|nr:L,D-transpeptidase [Methylocella sp. CPCC 101449]MDT2021216.1 L,D-transpeptidase [Methylocella sp. CPCC 101449]
MIPENLDRLRLLPEEQAGRLRSVAVSASRDLEYPSLSQSKSKASDLQARVSFVVAALALGGCVSETATSRPEAQIVAQAPAALSHRDVHFLSLMPQVRPNPLYARMVVDNPTQAPPGTIVVDAQQRLLYLTLPDRKAIRYVVATGRDGFAWRGSVYVGRKADWPDWTPPPEMRSRDPMARWTAGGAENPLGARALYLYANGADTLYRIHGTNDPFSVGMPVSSGCIRMSNADIIDLASRVPNGTRVIVVHA